MYNPDDFPPLRLVPETPAAVNSVDEVRLLNSYCTIFATEHVRVVTCPSSFMTSYLLLLLDTGKVLFKSVPADTWRCRNNRY